MDYIAIRAQGNREYWDSVALLARLQKSSIAALVKKAVDIAYGEELALLRSHAASDVANSVHELPSAEADHA